MCLYGNVLRYVCLYGNVLRYVCLYGNVLLYVYLYCHVSLCVCLYGHVSLYVCLYDHVLGAIQVLHNVFFWKFDPHPPPRNASNIELYTFVTLFSGKSDTPTPTELSNTWMAPYSVVMCYSMYVYVVNCYSGCVCICVFDSHVSPCLLQLKHIPDFTFQLKLLGIIICNFLCVFIFEVRIVRHPSCSWL